MAPLDIGFPSTSSALARVVTIICGTIALQIATWKPNPPPRERNRKKLSRLEDASKNLLRPLMNFFSFAPGVIEFVAVLIRLVAPPDYDIITDTCAERISFHVLTLVGFVMVLCGMGIRLWCYRTLGKFFTFEIALLPDHQLITTGPYAIVRHPSYTGGLLALVGATLANLCKGSWGYECGMAFSWWGIGWGGFVALSTVIVIERCSREDKLLHNMFGEGWEVWRERARWKMLPCIF